MFISSLHLTNFRNHSNIALDFELGNNVIVGRNGLGKTNIVEAIHYCATLSSHRVANDLPLIRHDHNEALINAAFGKHSRRASLEIAIRASGSNSGSLNGNSMPKVRDVLGLVHAVIFSPEDLDLVRGEPAIRRAFLDEFCLQLRPAFAGLRLDYEKALRQRNSLLKSLGRRTPTGDALATLEAWDEQLVTLGALLIHSRIHGLHELSPYVIEHGQMISGDQEPLVATYCAKWVEEMPMELPEIQSELRRALEENRGNEIDRGQTVVGPHRDDIELKLNHMPAKGYASHGQSWSISLALKLAMFSSLRQVDDDPILILDDVFAELDATRRTRLESALTNVEQIIVTVADPDDIPEQLKGNYVNLSDVMSNV